MFKITRIPTYLAAIAQSFTLIAYLSLSGLFMFNAEAWFGPIKSWVGPILFLTFFSLSVMICGLAALAYPIWLIWDQKDVPEAIRVLFATLLFLLLFFFFLFILLLLL